MGQEAVSVGIKNLYSFSTTLSAWVENLASSGRSSKQAVSMVADGIVAVLALWLAYTLRHGMAFSDFRSTWYLFLAIPVITVLMCMALGVYRWVIRSTNFRLFRQILKASALTSFALLIVVFLFPPDRVNPRSLFIIFGLLLLLGMVTMRLVWQSLFDSGKKGEPIAIYGAGTSGRMLADSVSLGSEFRPVLFIDDSPTLLDTTVSGIPVVSGANLEELKTHLDVHEVGRVILAMPSASKSVFSEQLDRLKVLNIPVQTIPSVVEIVTGIEKVDEFRDVSVKDILGRSEVTQDAQAVATCVKDKTVLVTGGGGSIGSELCRQIHRLGAKRLIVLDHSEENLYHITEELNRVSANKSEPDSSVAEFIPYLCSVKDKARVVALLGKYHVDTIYHAAAYKHVPIIERQPQQGVETNVFGTQIMLEAAINAGVANFTLISTDKAVRPTNAMGASKRVAELVLQAKARENHQTTISMVRFGNVLGSSGSVVPKFKEQIRAGGPITITHPDITRYFMTIPEAAQLVLRASAVAKGGEVFVLDMGEPVKIIDLAKTMVALSGSKLKEETGNPKDIEFVFDGLRPGEKMFEELFITENIPTTIDKVFSANESWIPQVSLRKSLVKLQGLIDADDDDGARRLLLELAFTGSEGIISEDNKTEKLMQNLDIADDIESSKGITRKVETVE